MPSDDLCGLLLNLLDNAIDASKGEPEADIHVYIRQQKDYLTLVIRNKTSRDVLRENPGLNTTKPNPAEHGLGLKIVRSIVEKHQGMLRTGMEDGYFTVHVMLRMS